MIRYHSFYAAHREGEYAHLIDDRDRRLLDWVRAFNPYDLYSKGHERPDVAALGPTTRADRRVLPAAARLVIRQSTHPGRPTCADLRGIREGRGGG